MIIQMKGKIKWYHYYLVPFFTIPFVIAIITLKYSKENSYINTIASAFINWVNKI